MQLSDLSVRRPVFAAVVAVLLCIVGVVFLAAQPLQIERHVQGALIFAWLALAAYAGLSWHFLAHAHGWSIPWRRALNIEHLLVAAALAEGWAVSVPDHEGTHGLWGAPHEPGYRALDGLRAALGYRRVGLSPEAPIGLWGYSGGGLATAWTAEEHGTYAPELNIVGAVLGSPIADLGSTFRRLNGSIYAGLPGAVVAALTHIYPQLDRLLQEHTTDQGKNMLASIQRMTTLHAIARFAGTDMGNMIDRPLTELLDLPQVEEILAEIKLGSSVPTPPVLIVQAVHDQIGSVADIDALAEAYVAGGANVTYHRDRFCDHILLHPLSAPMALRWLIDRFEGRPLDEHIVRTTWPTLLNPMTYLGMWRLGKVAARVLTSRGIGRNPL